MAGNQKFSYDLEFNTQFKFDESKVDKIAKDFEKKFADISPDIKVDPDELRKGIASAITEFAKLEDSSKELDKLLGELDINLNSEPAQKALKDIEDMLKDIDNVDMSKVEEALKSLGDADLSELTKSMQKAFDTVSVDGTMKEIDKLANEYEKIVNETTLMVDKQKKALAQMKATGQEGSDNYKLLSDEIDKNVQKLNELIGVSGEAADATGKIAESAKEGGSFMDFAMKFESVGKLGESLSAFAEKGMEAKNAMGEFSAKTGIVGEELSKLRSEANDLFVAGIGSSVAESIQALGTAQQQLKNFLDPQGIKDFTIAAGGISKVFEADINTTLSKSRTFIANFGLDGKKAGELVSYAFQQTGHDDILDTLDEYSQLMVKAGYSAEEFVGVLSTGMKMGSRDTDKLADSIKETQIRLNAGDTSRAIKDIQSSVSAQINAIVQSAESGQISIKEMTTKTSQILAEAASRGDITASIRDQYATAISGTMAEDMGGELWTKLFSAKIDPSAVTAQAKVASEQINSVMQPTTFVEGIQRKLEVLKTSVSETLGPIASQLGSALSSIASVAPGLSVMGEQFGKLSGYVSGLGGLSGALGSLSSGALGAAKSFITMGAAFIATPIGATIAAAVALVAAIKLISSLTNKTAEDKLKEAKAEEDGLNAQKKSLEVQKDKIKSNQELVKSYEELGNKTNRTAEEENRLNDIKVKLAGAYPGVISGTKSFSENLSALKTAAANSQGELGNLNTKLTDLDKQIDKAHLITVNMEVNASKEKIEDTLTSKFSEISWDKAVDGAKVGMEMGGPMGSAMLGAFMPFADKVSEFLFGTSMARKKSEEMIKPYTDAMYKATSSSELEKATTDFKSMVMSRTDIDEKMKGELLKNIDDMNKKKATAIEEGNKITAKAITEGLKVSYQDGVMTDEEISQISKKYGKTEAEVRKLFDTVKSEANKAKVGQILSSALEIKGEIKSNEKVDALVKNYKNAKTEVEKSQIGDVLAKAAPGAVQAAQQFIDSNGNLRTSYKLLDDKVKESTQTAKERYTNDLKAKQDELIGMIDNEGEAYQKTKAKMQGLVDEINKRKAVNPKADTTDLEKQLGDLKGNLQASEKDIANMGLAAIKSGKGAKDVYAEVAKQTGKSPIEAKKLVDETIKAANSAKGLADTWDANSKKLQENINQSRSAMLEFNKKYAAIAKKKVEDRTDDEKQFMEGAKKERAEMEKTAKTSIKESKNVQKQQDAWDVAHGLKESDALAKAKEMYGLDTARLATDKAGFEWQLKMNQINEKRASDSYDELLMEKENLRVLQEQEVAWKKALKTKGLITELKDGTVQINTKIKKADQAEIKQSFADSKKTIAESMAKIADIQLKLKVDTTEANKAYMELRGQQIEWEINIGVRKTGDYTEIINFYKQQDAELVKETNITNSKLVALEAQYAEAMKQSEYLLTAERKQEIDFRFQNEINTAKKAYTTAAKALLDNKKALADINQKSLTERLEAYDKFYEKEKDKLDKSNATLIDRAVKIQDAYKSAVQRNYDKSKASDLANIDSKQEIELKNLDKWKELELITEDTYNRKKEQLLEASNIRKQKLEEKYASRSMITDAMTNQIKIQAQTDADIKQAQLTRDRDAKKLAALEATRISQGFYLDKAQQEQYDILSKSLKETDQLLAEKGTLMGNTLGVAGENISNAITGMFAGSKEAAVESIRQLFGAMMGIMAGYLTKKIEGTILDMVLDWFTLTPGDPISKLLLAPIVHTLISSGVNAIAKPIIDGMTDVTGLWTGGRVDQPTLAVVGDAAKAGAGRNREWIFNDPQLIDTIQMATIGSQGSLVNEIRNLYSLLATQTLETDLKGTDVRISLLRTEKNVNMRAR